MKILGSALSASLLFLAALGAAEPLQQVEFVLPDPGWFFTASPDGSLHGQFGSLPGDAMHLPAGTIDFEEIAKEVEKLPCVQAAIRHKGEVSVNLKQIDDDGYFRKLFLEHRDDWIGWMDQPPNDRIRKLMKAITYYKNEDPDASNKLPAAAS